jgi:hypothetical protein
VASSLEQLAAIARADLERLERLVAEEAEQKRVEAERVAAEDAAAEAARIAILQAAADASAADLYARAEAAAAAQTAAGDVREIAAAHIADVLGVEMHSDLFTAVDDRIAEGTVAGLAFRVVALGNDCDLWLLHRGAQLPVSSLARLWEALA